jgi:hypothetical protein
MNPPAPGGRGQDSRVKFPRKIREEEEENKPGGGGGMKEKGERDIPQE